VEEASLGQIFLRISSCFILLLVITILLYLSPASKVCDGSDQTKYYHLIRLEVAVSSLAGIFIVTK
jgi:hypothetical protein